MSRINICFACDDNYAKLCGVSIASILNNAKDSDELNFYILDYHISEKNKAKFEHLKKIKDCEINFFKIDDERFKNLKRLSEHSILFPFCNQLFIQGNRQNFISRL